MSPTPNLNIYLFEGPIGKPYVKKKVTSINVKLKLKMDLFLFFFQNSTIYDLSNYIFCRLLSSSCSKRIFISYIPSARQIPEYSEQSEYSGIAYLHEDKQLFKN
jgi:hypothetical protein